MELLEFKNKILKLCKTDKVSEIGQSLYSAVINHDVEFYDEYINIIDDTKDWLQALWQYYEADRTEKKQDYTPVSLCEFVATLAGSNKSIYDCCGGSGALTTNLLKTNPDAEVYVEELDERVIPFLLFNLALRNAEGVVKNGNVLTREFAVCYKLTKTDKYSFVEIQSEQADKRCDVAISNPPYNIKWSPPTPIEAIGDGRFPVVPPASNANYAFVLNCMSRADKVIMILPNGVLSEQTETAIRQHLIENDLISAVITMPDKMFEVTSISTCIFVLDKNKKHKGKVIFVDSRKNCISEEREQNGQYGGSSHTNRTYKKAYNVLKKEHIDKIISALDNGCEETEFCASVENKELANNEYILVPSRYIKFAEKEAEHRPIQEIADNINYIQQMQNSCKLIINETIAKALGIDVEAFKEERKASDALMDTQKELGVTIVKSDYIQFTKNKNEFVFKCNDKELVPDILISFLNAWKNQIALLNTMQNKYLAELRDALLPDLMSGKIEV